MLRQLADNRNPDSLAARLRRKRFGLFLDLLGRVPGEVRVLDVGGSATFWKVMGFEQRRVSVTLMNLTRPEIEGQMNAVVGDARDMRQFGDQAGRQLSGRARRGDEDQVAHATGIQKTVSRGDALQGALWRAHQIIHHVLRMVTNMAYAPQGRGVAP